MRPTKSPPYDLCKLELDTFESQTKIQIELENLRLIVGSQTLTKKIGIFECKTSESYG